MLSNIITMMMSSFPGTNKLDPWKDSWTNWISGNGEHVGQYFEPGGMDKAVNFYYDHQHFFHVLPGWVSSLEGWLQNAIYISLYGLASLSTLVIQGALYLFTILPNALMNKASPLHQTVVMLAAVGVGLMTISLMFLTVNGLRGGKNNQLKNIVSNAGTSIALMALIPFIAGAIGTFMTTYVIPSVSVGSTTSLAAAPLRDNTLDISTWALDGFQSEPFSSSSPNLNGLGNFGVNDIPDFGETMTAGNINQLNQTAKGPAYNNKSQTPHVDSNAGQTSQRSTDITSVGNTFQYRLKASPVGDGKYYLENLDVKDGLLSFSKYRYKRYYVQNLSAIGAYIVIILVGLLLAFKIMRSIISAYVDLGASALQAGRDAGSAQPMKAAVAKQVNVALAATLDIVFLQLFISLLSSVPNDVANYVNGLPGGSMARPIVYLFTYAALGLATFNGSSVMEKAFGVESGYNNSTNLLNGLTAPGAFFGAALGSRISAANQKRKLEKAIAEEEKPGAPETPKGGGFTDNSAQALEDVYKKGEDEMDDPLAADSQDSDSSSDNPEESDAEGTPDTGQNNYEFDDPEGEADASTTANGSEQPGDVDSSENASNNSAGVDTVDEEGNADSVGLVDQSGLNDEDQEPEGDLSGNKVVSNYSDDNKDTSPSVSQSDTTYQSVGDSEGVSQSQQAGQSNASGQARRQLQQFNQQKTYEREQKHKQAQVARAQRFKRLLEEEQPHAVNDATHANSHGEID